MRRANEILKLALQLMTALVGASVASVIALLIMDALHYRALVIELLRTPGEMAQRGLDGTALATQLLDELRALEAATDSAPTQQT